MLNKPVLWLKAYVFLNKICTWILSNFKKIVRFFTKKKKDEPAELWNLYF